jgi:hypothetical protein
MQTGIKTFFEKTPLFESVQMAKDYLLKRYAESKKIKTSEIPAETKDKILKDPDFIAIRDMVQKDPGYTPLFVKFFFDQKAPIGNLQVIYDLLKEFKQNILKDLPMKLNDYGEMIPKKGKTPGWEILEDDLRLIPRKIKLRKLYNALLPKMKEEFEKATEEQIKDLTEIANEIDRLQDKEGIDDKGNKITRKPWRSYEETLGKYENSPIPGYPGGYYDEYRNPKEAFRYLIEDSKKWIETWNTDEDEIIETIKGLGAKVGFLYNEDGYVIVSARNSKAVEVIGASTPWCVKVETQYWRYNEGNVQLIIINKNISTVNVNSLIGLTVTKNQIVKDAFDKNNKTSPTNSLMKVGITLENFLKGLKFPPSVIERTLREFEREKSIKIALEIFFKEGSHMDVSKIVSSLVNINRGLLEGKFAEDEWAKIVGIVSILVKEEENLKVAEFIKFFEENGLATENTWRVFDTIVKEEYTEESMEKILQSTMDAFDTMEYILYNMKNRSANLKPKEIEIMKKALENKDAILAKFKSKM